MSLFTEKTVIIYQISNQETCKDILIILHVYFAGSFVWLWDVELIQMIWEHLTWKYMNFAKSRFSRVFKNNWKVSDKSMNKSMPSQKMLLIKLLMGNSKHCKKRTFENFFFPSYQENHLNWLIWRKSKNILTEMLPCQREIRWSIQKA